MRLVELSKFLSFRKKLDIRVTIYFSAMVGIAFFIIVMFSGFFMGLLWGIIMFGVSFGIIYGIRVMTNKGVDRKRSNAEVFGTVLDVAFDGEFGLLAVDEEKFKYISLQKFGLNKVPEIEINEDLFIGIGRYKFGKLQKLKLGADVKCQITLKSMPNGVMYIFDFYDVDGALEKMTEALDKVNKFNLEKHQ